MSDKKISQLSSATTPLAGTEELAIVQGGSTVKATAQDVADLAGGLPYVSYSALVNQTGTNAPISTILSNDTTLTFTWSYVNVGIYDLNISSAVDLNKVLVLSSIQFYNGPGATVILIFEQNSSTATKLRFRCGQAGAGTFSNNLLLNHGLEIRLYP